MVKREHQAQPNRTVGIRRSGMHDLTTLPRWSPALLKRAGPAELVPAILDLVRSLGAEAWSIDSVLWVVYPSLMAARDPRASLLPVHVPALFESAVEPAHPGVGLVAEGARDQ